MASVDETKDSLRSAIKTLADNLDGAHSSEVALQLAQAMEAMAGAHAWLTSSAQPH